MKKFPSEFRIEFNYEIFDLVVYDVYSIVCVFCEMLLLMLEKHFLLVAMMAWIHQSTLPSNVSSQKSIWISTVCPLSTILYYCQSVRDYCLFDHLVPDSSECECRLYLASGVDNP